MHVSDVGRLDAFIENYRPILECDEQIRLVVSCCPDLENIDEIAKRVQVFRVVACNNEGLDIGGYITAYDSVKQELDDNDYVFKCHDKSNVDWLKKMVDPLMLTLHHTVCREYTRGEKRPCIVAAYNMLSMFSNHHPYRHAYWLLMLGHPHGLPKEAPMVAGSAYIVRADCLHKWMDIYGRRVRPHMTRLGKFDPSWYHYRHAEQLHQFPAETPQFIVEHPLEFAQKMRETYVANKASGELETHASAFEYKGPAIFAPSGDAVRDGMPEHAIERLLLNIESDDDRIAVDITQPGEPIFHKFRNIYAPTED